MDIRKNTLAMDFDSLSPFPQWEDEKYDNEEGDEWKSALKNERAKKLYNQWVQVYLLIEALCENLHPSSLKTRVEAGLGPDYTAQMKDLLLADALIIPAKISGAEAGDLYILRMENAAIIRKTAIDVSTQCSSFSLLGIAQADEINAVLNEIEIFKTYFQEWVENFEKDEFADEWGLF